MSRKTPASLILGNPWSIFVLRGDVYKQIPRTAKAEAQNFNRLGFDDLHNLRRIYNDVRIIHHFS